MYVRAIAQSHFQTHRTTDTTAHPEMNLFLLMLPLSLHRLLIRGAGLAPLLVVGYFFYQKYASTKKQTVPSRTGSHALSLSSQEAMK